MASVTATNFSRKLHRFLDEGHKIEISRMPKWRGWILIECYPTHIKLDPTTELIPTLIHEALHYFYPEKSEKWVLKMEQKIVSQLTDRQLKNILCKLVRKID